MKLLDNDNKKYIFISLLLFLITFIGVSFAYFTTMVVGNDFAKNNVIETGTLALEFIDGAEVNVNGMIPGQIVEKEFSIKNTGTLATTYDVYFSETVNTFNDKEDLVYEIISENGCANSTQRIVPEKSSVDSKMVSNCSIESGQTHDYVLKIIFKETDDNQNDNLKVKFKSKIAINSFEEANEVAILENGLDLNYDFKCLSMNVTQEMIDQFNSNSELNQGTNFKNNLINNEDTYIKSFKRVNIPPTDEDKYKIISSDDSGVDIYAWYSDDEIKIYADTDKIYLNDDSSYLFYLLHSITNIDFTGFDTSLVKDFGGLFFETQNLTNLVLGNDFDTSNALNMSAMFYKVSNLESLNLGNKFDTSKVTDMEYMFAYMNHLTELNLGENFDTSNVKTMDAMFYNVRRLTSLDLGEKFDTSNVTLFNNMFDAMNALESLDLKDKFYTSKATEMEAMFASTHKLKTLNLGPHFDTSNVTTMKAMFCYANSITELDLGQFFDVSKVTNFAFMFQRVDFLTTIYVGQDWNLLSDVNSTSMFESARYLVGGKGTSFNRDYQDKTYARVDDPDNGRPGYLTLKEY